MKKSLSNRKIKKISFFYRSYNSRAVLWDKKIRQWLKSKHPQIKIVEKNFDALIVLGGDGSVLEAAKLCLKSNALLVSLNLGTVGFLSSVRKKTDFFPALNNLFSGKYFVTSRTILKTNVIRRGKKVFSGESLNEAAIINPLAMVELDAFIDEKPVQKLRGTGAMVASATGSTAYNLSAHGPVVMPEAKNLVLTEILGYGIPSPSIVLNEDQDVSFTVRHFRKRELLSVTKTKEIADLLFVVDGETIFPLNEGDVIKVGRSSRQIKMAEFEAAYFLKSLKGKFLSEKTWS